MPQNIVKIIVPLAAVIAIFLGGFAYSYLFWNHPYMGGYPDVAILAQSTQQTIQNERIVSTRPDGQPLALQLFPFGFLENTGMTLLNGLEPILNLWILQQLFPYLYVALFFLIGRNLFKSTLGGILTAFATGVIADLPLFTEQTFTLFISSYTLSFIFFITLIAFLPFFWQRSSPQFGWLLVAILTLGTLFSHYHYGPIRYVAILFGIGGTLLLLKKHLPTTGGVRLQPLLISLGLIPVFFLLTNIKELPSAWGWGVPYLLANLSAGSTAVANHGPAVAQPSAIFQILYLHPLLGFIAVFGLAAFVPAVYLLRKKPTVSPQNILILLLLLVSSLHLALFNLHLPFPSRHLREAETLLVPLALFFFWRMLRLFPLPFTAPLLALFFTAGTLAWFPKMFTLENTLNTHWNNIQFLSWARTHLPPRANILTDPFTFFILKTSLPYINEPPIIAPDGKNTKNGLMLNAAQNDIMLPNKNTLARALQTICPEYIIIDPPQTSQFFNISPAKTYYQYPNTLQVLFDSGGPPNQRVLILKPKELVCLEK